MEGNDEKDILIDIRIKLARIEENTKGLDELQKDTNRALAISRENQKDITEIKTNNKWAWGFIITLGLTIIGYFFTKF